MLLKNEQEYNVENEVCAYLHSCYLEATGKKKKLNKNPQSDFRKGTRE